MNLAGIAFDEYVAAAGEAFVRDGGEEALLRTGWSEIVAGDLAEPEERAGVLALFVAQGATKSSSAALSILASRPYLLALGETVRAEEGVAFLLDRGDVGALVAVPACGLDIVLVDVPDRGTYRLRMDDTTAIDAPAIDPTVFSVRRLPTRLPTPVLDAQQAQIAGSEATAWSALAIACELLGAASALVELGVDHARAREQFGRPIASFQAVRHLLAWGAVERDSIAGVCAAVIRGMDGARPEVTHARVAKAVAGRSARRVADRTMQVLGASGFTWENPHHEYLRRILLLDSLLGGSDGVARELGHRCRVAGELPDLFPLCGQVPR